MRQRGKRMVAQTVKNLPAMQETQVWSLGWEDCLEKEMAIHSSIVAWRIPWTEEPGGLQSMGSHRVGHDWSDFTFTFHFHALEKEMATYSSVLAWRIPGTREPGGLPSMGLQSQTRLKRLSSSSSSSRTWKQPRCPSTDGWIKKLWYIYTMVYDSAMKRNICESVLVR